MKIELMFVIVTGMICIAALECVAMANGINGMALAGAIGAIGTIIGGTFTYLITKIKAKKDRE